MFPHWLIIAAPVLVFVLALAAWAQWRTCGQVWRYWTAPLRNDQHRFLSLARLTACAVIVIGQVPVMAKDFFWTHGGAWLVGFETLILFSDILTSKLAMIVLPALAGKMGMPSVAVPVAGLNAAPNVEPQPAPDLKPTEQAG